MNTTQDREAARNAIGEIERMWQFTGGSVAEPVRTGAPYVLSRSLETCRTKRDEMYRVHVSRKSDHMAGFVLSESVEEVIVTVGGHVVARHGRVPAGEPTPVFPGGGGIPVVCTAFHEILIVTHVPVEVTAVHAYLSTPLRRALFRTMNVLPDCGDDAGDGQVPVLTRGMWMRVTREWFDTECRGYFGHEPEEAIVHGA